MIKIGLTKWVRQLSRGLNVGIFIRMLKDKAVINDTIKRKIEEEYTYEQQMSALILNMINETKFNLYTMCQCLRQLAPLLSDLVENTNTDGEQIGMTIFYLNDTYRKLKIYYTCLLKTVC